jgi:hypothetical protein
VKLVTTARPGEQRVFETVPEENDVVGRLRSRWKNNVDPETWKELQANISCKGDEEDE